MNIPLENLLEEQKAPEIKEDPDYQLQQQKF